MKLGWIAKCQNRNRMRLVTRIKWRIWWARITRWLWLPILVALLSAMPRLVTIVENRLPSVASAFEDEATASLTGAVLGGVLALYASIRVQRHEVRLRAAVSRRDDVFVPLYEELLALRRHLQRDPCPHRFQFNADLADSHSPRFVVWPSFKQDSRRLRVPGLLTDALDGLLATINDYTSAYEEARRSEQVNRTVKGIIVSELGEHHSARKDLAYHYLPCSQNLSSIRMMIKDEVDMSRREKASSSPSEVDADAVAQRLYRECRPIDSVKRLQAIRSDLDRRLNELIEAIEVVIRFINERFEQHERWF